MRKAKKEISEKERKKAKRKTCTFAPILTNRGIIMNIALEDRIKLSVYTVRVVPLIMFMWTGVICLLFLTVIRTRISDVSRSEPVYPNPVFWFPTRPTQNWLDSRRK